MLNINTLLPALMNLYFALEKKEDNELTHDNSLEVDNELAMAREDVMTTFMAFMHDNPDVIRLIKENDNSVAPTHPLSLAIDIIHRQMLDESLADIYNEEFIQALMATFSLEENKKILSLFN